MGIMSHTLSLPLTLPCCSMARNTVSRQSQRVQSALTASALPPSSHHLLTSAVPNMISFSPPPRLPVLFPLLQYGSQHRLKAEPAGTVSADGKWIPSTGVQTLTGTPPGPYCRDLSKA